MVAQELLDALHAARLAWVAAAQRHQLALDKTRDAEAAAEDASEAYDDAVTRYGDIRARAALGEATAEAVEAERAVHDAAERENRDAAQLVTSLRSLTAEAEKADAVAKQEHQDARRNVAGVLLRADLERLRADYKAVFEHHLRTLVLLEAAGGDVHSSTTLGHSDSGTGLSALAHNAGLCARGGLDLSMSVERRVLPPLTDADLIALAAKES